MVISPSVVGRNALAARSFVMTFNGSAGGAVHTATDVGGYLLNADHDCWVKLTPAASPVDVTVPGSSQPAAGSENQTVFVMAGRDFPLDVPAQGLALSVLGATTTGGALRVSGPMTFSQVR